MADNVNMGLLGQQVAKKFDPTGMTALWAHNGGYAPSDAIGRENMLGRGDPTAYQQDLGGGNFAVFGADGTPMYQWNEKSDLKQGLGSIAKLAAAAYLGGQFGPGAEGVDPMAQYANIANAENASAGFGNIGMTGMEGAGGAAGIAGGAGGVGGAGGAAGSGVTGGAAGGASGAGGLLSGVGDFLGSNKGIVGAVVGGLLGSQPNTPTGQNTTQNKIDPRLDPYIYGDSGILAKAKQLYDANPTGMNSRMTAGLDSIYNNAQASIPAYQQMQAVGQGLLGQGMAGNPFTNGQKTLGSVGDIRQYINNMGGRA